ncbi:hypothetical protein [Paenibacillus sp. 1001270B_150601_E10]|uniref:hypothetical protein n=1 Tax=Paenibacillus sp. 1001270B_150601_E10 TaxID=2787079 RepID=UPI0018A0528D|nr:hypothetical protein [Paenibacillus sp. 1001270B_150601_E10]
MNRIYQPPGIIIKLIAGMLSAGSLMAVIGYVYSIPFVYETDFFNAGYAAEVKGMLLYGVKLNLIITLLLILPMSMFADTVSLHLSRWGRVLSGTVSIIQYVLIGIIAHFIYVLYTGDHMMRNDKLSYFIILAVLFWLFQLILSGLKRLFQSLKSKGAKQQQHM